MLLFKAFCARNSCRRALRVLFYILGCMHRHHRDGSVCMCAGFHRGVRKLDLIEALTSKKSKSEPE